MRPASSILTALTNALKPEDSNAGPGPHSRCYVLVQEKNEAPSSIAMVARRGARPRLGQEIKISYGDKSNEELLMLYGEIPALVPRLSFLILAHAKRSTGC